MKAVKASRIFGSPGKYMLQAVTPQCRSGEPNTYTAIVDRNKNVSVLSETAKTIRGAVQVHRRVLKPGGTSYRVVVDTLSSHIANGESNKYAYEPSQVVGFEYKPPRSAKRTVPVKAYKRKDVAVSEHQRGAPEPDNSIAKKALNVAWDYICKTSPTNPFTTEPGITIRNALDTFKK